MNSTGVDPSSTPSQVTEAATTAGATKTWLSHVGPSYLLPGAWLGSEKDGIVGHPQRKNAQSDPMHRG